MIGKKKLGKLKIKISEAKKISIQKKCNIIITKYKNNFTRKISSRHAIDNEESMKLYYNKLTKKIRILESYNKKLALVKRTTLINFYISLRDSKYIALKRESERYWNKNPNEKKEYDETIRKFYIDLAWDISWFKDISTSMVDLAIHWTWVIKKDPELIKLWWDELKWDLALLAWAVSPSKKFRKMVEIEKKLKKLKSSIKLWNIQTKVNNILKLNIWEIKKIYPNAKIWYRGSVATWIKYKTWEAIDLNKFDVDAFIISDKLYNKFKKDTFFRSAKNVDDWWKLNKICNNIEKSLKKDLKWYYSEKWKELKFRIYSNKEFQQKVKWTIKIID